MLRKLNWIVFVVVVVVVLCCNVGILVEESVTFPLQSDGVKNDETVIDYLMESVASI